MTDQFNEAEFGDAGASVGDYFVCNLGIAALDQDVGNDLADLRAAGNRDKKILAFCPGNFSEHLVIEQVRLFENRPGNRNIVVTRQAADNVHRCIVQRRQFLAQFDERRGLCFLDQATDDIVENGDLIVR